jgi:hypothetical protein
VGYFPVFKIKQWEIRKNIEWIIQKNINNDDLIHLAIPTNYPLKWEREGREFWFEGQLYDVVRSEIKDSITQYYCINDTKETELCANFDDFFQKKLKNDANTEGSSLSDFFKDISKIYIPLTHCFPDNHVELSVARHPKAPIPFSCFYTSLSINLIDPPPKNLV